MSFLAPLFLSLALLAGVPVLVHFLRRRIKRRVDFPAVRYLQRMEREHSRDRKLRNRLLLLVRVLIVLAIALAAARPVARLSGSGHSPIAVALIVDNSMSSGAVVEGRRQLDRIRESADALLSRLNAADQAWLISAEGKVTGGSGEVLRQALAAMEPVGGSGDIAAAVRRGIGLVRGAASHAPAVAVAIDGLANALHIDPASVVEAANVPVVILVPDTILRSNGAIVSAVPEPVRWVPSGSLTFGFAGNSTADYRVELDGRTVSRGTVGGGTMLEPGRVTLRLSSQGSGWVRGVVESAPDDLRADDSRFFAVQLAPPPVIAADKSAGVFLSAAVATLVDERRLGSATTGVSAAAVSRTSVVVAGADAAALRLPAFITAPADPIHIGEANRNLSRSGIPWRFGAIARDAVSARAWSAADTTAFTGGGAIDGARVHLRYPLQYAGAEGSVQPVDTIAMAGGTPWIVAGSDYVIVGSPIDHEATELPLRAGFVPWLLHALSQRLGGEGTVAEVISGGTVTGFAGADSIEAADSTVSAWYPGSSSAPQEPGVYYLRSGQKHVGTLVVNVDARESDITAADSAVISSGFEGSAISIRRSGNAWQSQVLAAAEGRSLTIPLIVVALLLIALESVLARSTAAVSRENQ